MHINLRAERQVQRSTFYLIGCDRCDTYAAAPERAHTPEFVSEEIMTCAECGRPLSLVEAFTAPQTQMWQLRPGHPWMHVVYPSTLPEKAGRQLWTDP